MSHRAQPCPSRPGVPVTCGPCPSRHTGQGCLGSQYPGSLPWGTPAESHGHRRGRSMPQQAAGAAGHPRGLAGGPAWASPAPARPPLTAASAFPPSPRCPLLGRSGRGVREARLHPPPGLASYPRRPRGLPASAPAAGRTLGAGGEPLPPSGPRDDAAHSLGPLGGGPCRAWSAPLSLPGCRRRIITHGTSLKCHSAYQK